MEYLTERERLRYLAGIMDGEGCIGAWNRRAKDPTRRRVHAEVSLRICMTTPFAVQMFHETFGGALFAEKRKGTKRRQTFAWVATATKAENCLRALVPFLREKREQAETALALMAIMHRPRPGLPRLLSDEELAERQ